MRKKFLMVALAMMMTLTLSVPVAFAGVPTGDPLQDNDKIVDIFINADIDSSIDPEVIKAMLAEKLNGGTKIFSGSTNVLTADDIRINTNVMSIDVSDLSKWVVYDHYGSNVGATFANNNLTGKGGELGYDANYNAATVDVPDSWSDVFGDSSIKRPYFAYYESSMTNYYDELDPSYIDNSTVYKIEDYLNLSENAQLICAPLNQHIYALKDSSDNYAMTFVGYGSPGYCDFLYYPTTSAGKKEVSFSVNSQYVNTHTMNSTIGGAGFLLNSGIDPATGFISGYVLIYQFDSPDSLNGIRLLKINDGVKADDFHQNGMFNGWSGPAYVSDIMSVGGLDWSSIMDINLEITPTSVKVLQKASTESEYAEIINETLDDTGYNGFGPFTQYSSHGCSDSTQFRFTELEMGFAADSTSILDALSKANFLAGSEKYFVNLLHESGGSSVSDEDWEGITRMRDGKIRYVTNVDNPFLNDGGVVTSGAPNGSNGKTIKTYADLDELTDKIAAYILQKNTYVTPSGTITLSNPVAIFDLRAMSNESVATVVRDFVGSGLPIYTQDTSKPSAGKTIETYKYKITSPSGVVQTLADRAAPASASNPLMTVETDTEPGIWTINLMVVDSADKTSSSATATFQVVEAEEYDVSITAGAHMTLQDTSTQTVTQYSAITDISVTADEGYVLPAAYSIGHGLYFVRLTETTGKVSGIPTDDVTATLKDARKASVITCTLGTGTEPTPDKTKYYITVLPSDPAFEYNVIDGKGNIYPTGNPWTPGSDGSIVFGPLALGDTYKVVARPIDSEEFAYEEIDSFTLIEPVDTGDHSQTGLLAFLVFGSLAGAFLAFRRKNKQTE